MIEKKWAMGLWKFSPKIPLNELVRIAELWASEDPNYLQLYIRRVSKDQLGIGFTYQFSQEIELPSASRHFYDQTTNYLKKTFGNEFAGCDAAQPVWLIKNKISI